MDATIIAAPPSTKNASVQRDTEMHQPRKGNQWYFGTKAHIGMDSENEKAKSRYKSKVRVKVEHCFGVTKRVFGFTNVRYRGVNKNADGLFACCALVNLFMVRRQLLAG